MDSNDAYRAIEYLAKGDIQHYGILGMKWGVRRYQNKDGTLTKAGRKRAAKLAKQYDKVTGRDISTAERAKTRLQEIKEMTTEELTDKTRRMNAERAYIQAINDYTKLTSANTPKAKKLAKHIVKLAGDVGNDAAKQILKNYIVSAANEKLGLKK